MKIKWKNPEKDILCVHEKDSVVYLTYPMLDKCTEICHGFSTRLGGVSKDIYASMNLSFSRGDEKACVEENFRRIAHAMGFSANSMVFSDQTHTANVRVVGRKDRENWMDKKQFYTNVDGMITNQPGVTLATFYADCVPLYFVDPVHHAIGLSHSGWRGTVGKIGKVTVEKMHQEYGSDPQDIIAAIGPSICQDCYQVSEDVIQEFKQAFPKDQWPELFYSQPEEKYQLNLWKANELIFREAGISQDHIAYPNLCTCCNPEFLFSHRASHGRRGNLAAFLQIREEDSR